MAMLGGVRSTLDDVTAMNMDLTSCDDLVASSGRSWGLLVHNWGELWTPEDLHVQRLCAASFALSGVVVWFSVGVPQRAPFLHMLHSILLLRLATGIPAGGPGDRVFPSQLLIVVEMPSDGGAPPDSEVVNNFLFKLEPLYDSDGEPDESAAHRNELRLRIQQLFISCSCVCVCDSPPSATQLLAKTSAERTVVAAITRAMNILMHTPRGDSLIDTPALARQRCAAIDDATVLLRPHVTSTKAVQESVRKWGLEAAKELFESDFDSWFADRVDRLPDAKALRDRFDFVASRCLHIVAIVNGEPLTDFSNAATTITRVIPFAEASLQRALVTLEKDLQQRKHRQVEIPIAAPMRFTDTDLRDILPVLRFATGLLPRKHWFWLTKQGLVILGLILFFVASMFFVLSSKSL